MNLHSIENENVLFKDESSVILEFMVTAASDFFDGHFPKFKLLPAVAQFELVSRFACKYFGIGRGVSSIRRMKFSAPVLPDAKVRMNLNFDSEKNSVAFELKSATGKDKIFSSGSFKAVKN